MTMPHLMNCEHRNEGWCADCVKRLGEENLELREKQRAASAAAASLACAVSRLKREKIVVFW